MFISARPIFLKGLSATPDVQAGFVLPFSVGDRSGAVVLRCAAATFYRAYLNGQIVAHGPARAAHGYARIDEIDIGAFLRPGENVLAIEVAGYNLDCIMVTGDASFVAAEIAVGGHVVAHTDNGCRALRLHQRLPAERFSHARCTGEVYRLDAAYVDWRTGRFETEFAVECIEGRKWMSRGVPLPDFRSAVDVRVIGCHSFATDPAIVVRPIGPLEGEQYLKRIAALDERPATECARERVIAFRGAMCTAPNVLAELTDLDGPGGVDLDFGRMQAGFITADIETAGPATIDLVFVDHREPDGGLNPRGGDMNGVIRLHLPGGRHQFQAFEAHCLRYLRAIVRGTPTATIHQIGVADYSYPDRPTGSFVCDDGDLNRIYDAARLTLRLNTQDIFIDCPGRERAGWLCDSLFSGRAMQVLFGDLSVERAMLENFLHAPDTSSTGGYFPECYPGRAISGGNFIPNWSMFLALELAEYVRRSGDVAFAAAYRGRIESLVAGIEKSSNAHGLLESLPGFTFVDWSRANDNEYKQPISTPTNALYAHMLDVMAELYRRSDWRERAAAVRATLGRFISDDRPIPDALRHDGAALKANALSSEAAQYYHFWTGAADARGAAAKWWKRLMTEHGPAPDAPPRETTLAPSNVFIGLYLRLETLAQQGEFVRLLREMRGLFLPMLARGPGTLWEHLKLEGSVCHGFAAHAAVWLVRDILGIGLADAIDRTVAIAPHPAGLAWAAGSVLVDGHALSVDWRCAGDRFSMNVSLPPGYSATITLPPEAERLPNCRVNGERVAIAAMRGRVFAGAVSIDVSIEGAD